ncbi:MAG: hypothetical protein Q9183_000972 [Haloplaca sp. 2 TL-2023]
MYVPRQNPESNSHRGLQKHATPAASPDGAPSPAGRRRARTKVVAWDPRDLEDIYYRKEVAKEDWDTICKVYPTRTKVAMRQQVIKMREKKQREADGLPPKSRKSSILADSSQSAPHNSQWASVNGGHPSENSEGEESGDNDEYDMSDAPDSDADPRHHNNNSDAPVRSTSLQTRAQATTDTISQQSATPSMPFEVQEMQPFNSQSPANFDVVAAQSKGKAIAPRQPPSSAVPTNPSGHGQPGPQVNQPTQRGKGKRAREKEAAVQDPNIDPETGLLTTMSKRRRQERESAGTETALMPGGSGENYATPTNTAVAMPVPPPSTMPPPPPPHMPQEAEVEQVCVQVREIYRAARAAAAAELRATQETFWASLERAHARTSEAEVRYDEVEMRSAEQIKENIYSSQAEVKKVISQLHSERAEKERLQSELDQHRREFDQHQREMDKHRRELMAARTNLEQLRQEKAGMKLGAPTAQMLPISDALNQEGVHQQLRVAQEKAERADTANNLLNEKVSEMRLDSKELCEKLLEIQKQHDEVTSSLDDLHSKDLEDLTNKLIRKHVNAVKEADVKLTDMLVKAKESLDKPSHLMFEGVAHPTTNGSSSAHQP